MPTASMLDVVDDFFLFRPATDLRTISGKALYELGDVIRNFAASYVAPPAPREGRVYLGGWPGLVQSRGDGVASA